MKTGTKTCTKCTVEKCFSNYGNSSYTKDGLRHVCRQCRKVISKTYYNNNKKDIKNKLNLYYKKNVDKFKKYRQDNIVRITEYNREYLKNNREYYIQYEVDNKDHITKRRSKWKKDNKGLVNANTAKRHAAKLQATVPGYDAELKEIYKNCPKGFEVDHIQPLQGKNVCGLHVPWNLQYLTPIENRRKGNRT